MKAQEPLIENTQSEDEESGELYKQVMTSTPLFATTSAALSRHQHELKSLATTISALRRDG